MSKYSTGLPDGPRLSKFDGMGSCLSLLEEERKKRGINTGGNDSDDSNPVLDYIDAFNEEYTKCMEVAMVARRSAFDKNMSYAFQCGYSDALTDLLEQNLIDLDQIERFDPKSPGYIASENEGPGPNGSWTKDVPRPINMTIAEKRVTVKRVALPFLFKRQQVLISELKTQIANQQK